MNDQLRWQITDFFNYWRQRYNFIHELDFNKHNHEANVLIWAALDALSNIWAKKIGKSQCGSKNKRLIFDAFLAHYGGKSFQVVSLPDVWNRIDLGNIKVNNTKLPVDISTFLANIGGRRSPSVLKKEERTRYISDDWNMEKIKTEVLAKYPLSNITELEEWLILSRFGSIAYKEMRSTYIHEGRSGSKTHNCDLHNSEIQPTYRSTINSIPPTIGFNVMFMLSVLECCINTFEAEALSSEQDPIN